MTDNILPSCSVPYTDAVDPNLMKDVHEKDEPQCTASRRDMHDPNLTVPYTDIEDPILRKLLHDIVEPKST